MIRRPCPPGSCQRHSRGGFTLIELVISIVLISLLAAVGTTMISDSFDLTYMMNGSQSSAAKARNTLERLEREIREVGYNAGSYRTSTANMTASSFTFTKSDGITTVAIVRSGTTLTLNGTPLTDNVDSFALAYLQIDSTGAVTTTTVPTNLRFVEISLTVRDAASGQAIPQLTRVALRNAG